MIKIIRATTVPISLKIFCGKMLSDLSSTYEVIGLSSPGEDLEEVAQSEGIKVIAVPMERHISIIKDLLSLIKMIKVFSRENPIMVHSMTPKAGLLCMIAALLTRVPVRVHTFTGLVFPTATGLRRRILMTTDWLTCACATHVIPEGEGVKNDLLHNNITKKPLKVLGYGNVKGVDMNYYSRRPEVMVKTKELKRETFTFVFVGRIVRDKGINELLEAFDKLSSQTEVRLFLVGTYEDDLDPVTDESKGIISRNPNVFSVGAKYGDELLAYYAASDCFVLPSYREGFPNTVLEAGAMGLPCIVTDINGSREIICEGVNGMIVKPKSVDELYHAMKIMVQLTSDRNKMGSKARKMIEDRFEQGFVRKCLYDYYDEILQPYK